MPISLIAVLVCFVRGALLYADERTSTCECVNVKCEYSSVEYNARFFRVSYVLVAWTRQADAKECSPSLIHALLACKR